MPQERLTFDRLGDVANGFVKAEFDRLLKETCEDIDQRPGINKEREITIKVTLSPGENKDHRGNPEGVDMGLQVYGRVPKSDVRVHSLKNTMADVGNGELQMVLMFNPAADENPNQLTLNDAQQKASG